MKLQWYYDKGWNFSCQCLAGAPSCHVIVTKSVIIDYDIFNAADGPNFLEVSYLYDQFRIKLAISLAVMTRSGSIEIPV